MNITQAENELAEILRTLYVGGLYGDRGDSQDRAHNEAKAAIASYTAKQVEAAEIEAYEHYEREFQPALAKQVLEAQLAPLDHLLQLVRKHRGEFESDMDYNFAIGIIAGERGYLQQARKDLGGEK